MGPQFNPYRRDNTLDVQHGVFFMASMGPQFNPCRRSIDFFKVDEEMQLQWGRSLIPADSV